MVHSQVRPLLALALEGLERAKMLFVLRLAAHGAALGFAVTAAVAASNHGAYDFFVECAAAAVAVLFEFAALWLHHHALELHSRGRQVMRRVMLLDALQPDEAPIVLERASPHFDKGIRRRAAAREERERRAAAEGRPVRNYYWSDKPTGAARLRDHLFESAIFSRRLYGAAFRFSLLCMIVLLGAAAVVLGFLIFAARGGEYSLVVRIVIALVAFLPACQELDHMLLYRMAEHHLGELLWRVEAHYGTPLGAGGPDPRLLAEYGDYSAATTYAPPIRTVVYVFQVDRLEKDFEARMRSLGQVAGPTPPGIPVEGASR